MKECDKRDSHISSELRMIYISSTILYYETENDESSSCRSLYKKKMQWRNQLRKPTNERREKEKNGK